MKTEAISEDIADGIRAFLKRELKPLVITDVRIKAEPDYEGDESIVVEVEYADRGEIDPKAVVRVLSRLRRELLARYGETRFPYIRHLFSEKQKVVVTS